MAIMVNCNNVGGKQLLEETMKNFHEKKLKKVIKPPTPTASQIIERKALKSGIG